MFAAHNRDRMGRLVAVIDANNSQVDGPVTSVTTLEPLADKWRAFGWRVAEVDGHDVDALCGRVCEPRRRRAAGGDRAHRDHRADARRFRRRSTAISSSSTTGLARALTRELEASLV